MNLEILDIAEADLLEGFWFYERQSPGIGAYFLDTLSGEIESLRLYAGMHRKVHGFRRLLCRRFPWAVYYEVEGGTVRIWRVLDCRRDPQRIRRELLGSRSSGK